MISDLGLDAGSRVLLDLGDLGLLLGVLSYSRQRHANASSVVRR